MQGNMNQWKKNGTGELQRDAFPCNTLRGDSNITVHPIPSSHSDRHRVSQHSNSSEKKNKPAVLSFLSSV